MQGASETEDSIMDEKIDFDSDPPEAQSELSRRPFVSRVAATAAHHTNCQINRARRKVPAGERTLRQRRNGAKAQVLRQKTKRFA